MPTRGAKLRKEIHVGLLRALLGSSGVLGCSLETVGGSLGSLGGPWGTLWGSLGPLGGSLGTIGGSLEALEGPLGAPGCSLSVTRTVEELHNARGIPESYESPSNKHI